MIRYAIIGSGWRSLFFVRIAKAFPEKFEMVAMLCRTEEKAERLAKEYDIHTTCDEAEIFDLKPDFIVSAVDKKSMSTVARSYAKRGIPVLQETPAALDVETLKEVATEVKNGLKLQVAEQYWLYPSIKAMIDVVDSGLIGEPVSISISAMHDYHAASVIRRLLKTGLESVSIAGKSYNMKVTDTRTRYEILTEGKVVEKEEKHLVMEYESGKVAFYDFMSDQYRSPIRNRYINIRGTRGEIINDKVYYLDEANLDASKTIQYENEFMDRGLTEDEAAIAQLLVGMKEYAMTGKEIYPMSEALYDAYLSIRMCEAGTRNFEKIKAEYKEI